MNSNKQFQYFFEMGSKFASNTNYLTNLINAGFYNAIEDLVNEKESQSKEKESQIKIFENMNSKFESNIEHLMKKKESIQNEIIKINENIDEENETLKNNIISLNSEIKQNENKINEFKNDINDDSKNPKRDKREFLKKIILRVIFWFLTISLLIFYWSAWYNGVFNQNDVETQNNSSFGLVRFIINPYFFYEAFQSNNYLGLLASLTLTGIPLGVSYVFHRAVFEKKYIKFGHWQYIFILGPVFVALALDFLLAYKIVEEIYNYKQFNGLVGRNQFSIGICFHEISFYIIFLISFITYFVWGIFLDDMINIEDPAEILKRQISQIIDLNATINEKISKLEKENIEYLKKQKEKQKELKDDVAKCSSEIESIEKLQQENNIKLKSLDTKIPISKFELEKRIEAFLAGWSKTFFENHRINETNSVDSKVSQFNSIKESFIEKILNNDHYFITEN